ncbi:GPR endopeptidase, partial [Bacillus pumilus]
IQGIFEKEKEEHGIRIRTVESTKEGEELTSKKTGTYLTLEAQGIREKDAEMQEKVVEVFARHLAQMLKDRGIQAEARCRVVGLGNWNFTPDELGPLTVE